MDCVIYIHGKGGSPQEAKHYEKLFPNRKVIGINYFSDKPWEAGKEIREEIEKAKKEYGKIILIANSIGAFFALNAKIDDFIEKAYFISPIVDMVGLIKGMMDLNGITEKQLKERGEIPVSNGEVLSWKYFDFVKNNPVKWKVCTNILYGEKDELTSFETISAFAKEHGFALVVMKDGEHWFHTDKQMKFLDEFIKEV